MASRLSEKQSLHDVVVRGAKQIYESKGKIVWINPDGEKNKSWCGYYIDVIAAESAASDKAWVTEIETEESVSESEASGQWKDYDKAYTGRWYLAVPVGSETKAQNLLNKNKIKNCSVITWKQNPDGTITFWGLPGI